MPYFGRIASAIALSSLLLAGCFYSPVGTNTAATLPATDASAEPAPLYPTPDSSGKVNLTYVPPANKADTTKVAFQLTPAEGKDPIQVEDDSPDDGFTAQFDASKLDPGLYAVDIFLGDDQDPSAKLPFIVPDTSANQDGNASGTANASGT